MLKSKIEVLADAHRHKLKYLSEVSRLLGEVGNYSEQKLLLTLTLELRRSLGNGFMVAFTLELLSRVNRNLNLYEEGIRQAKEALETFKRIGDTPIQMQCSDDIAWLFF
jgi:hypothetical protein